MGQTSINGKPIGPSSSRQVVSRSAILILSGVLIGTTIGQGSLSGLAVFRFLAGIVGLISYLGLELVAHSRRKRVLRKTLAVVDSTLKSRLSRHVSSRSPRAPKRKQLNFCDESSYLPVTVSVRA